ncbi:MAG: dephospho-CoA kinase [Oscillospiraceae bacterium]
MSERLVVGLTGMSGAGKSTVCRVFADNGFDVIDCDSCAREVTEPGMPALNELAERLSRELIRTDGTLDRRKTSELIFHDPEKRRLFNKIIYPYITYNIAEKLRHSGEYVLLDAPTLFEARVELLCGSIVSVTADITVCAERITARDNIPLELAEARLRSQHSAGFYRERSDFCLENNGTPEQLFEAAEQVVRLLKGE